MNKKITIIPLILSAVTLGVFSFTSPRVNKVSAENTRNYRYFLLNEDGTYGLAPGNLIVGSDNNTSSVTTYANLVKPIYVDVVTGGFHISLLDDNGVRFYAQAKDAENTYFHSNIANATIWTRSNSEVQGKFLIDSTDPARHLGFYNKNSVMRFGTNTNSSASFYNFNLTLLPVDDHPLVQALITAINNVDCSEHNPDKENDWDPVGEAYSSISDTPIINYLKVAPIDKTMNSNTLEGALAKYDYVCGKYKESKGFTDFLQRNPSYPIDGNNISTFSNIDNNFSIVLTSVAIVTVSVLTSFLFVRRKRG